MASGPPGAHADESERIERARAGDRDALAELLRRHAPALRASLAGRIPRRFRGVLSEDDVLQQTFTDAFCDVAGFVPRGEGGEGGEGAFAAWLRALAAHNLRDALRELRARKRGGDRTPVASLSPRDSVAGLWIDLCAPSSSTPSRRAVRREAIEALERAIDALPESHARVVRGIDLAGRSARELALELGRTPGAVYLLRLRALERLRRALGASSPNLSDSA